jgi:RNase P subunit RPR2
MGAKTVTVEQIANPCQQCGAPQIGKMHLDSDGRPEMMVVRCLKCGAQKRLYAGRREPRYKKSLLERLGITKGA